MHYGKTAFGRGRLTIRTNDPRKQDVIGTATSFSETDIKQINLMYCGGSTGGKGGNGGNGRCKYTIALSIYLCFMEI